MKIEEGLDRTGVLFRIRHRLRAPDIAAGLCPKRNNKAGELRAIDNSRIAPGPQHQFTPTSSRRSPSRASRIRRRHRAPASTAPHERRRMNGPA